MTRKQRTSRHEHHTPASWPTQAQCKAERPLTARARASPPACNTLDIIVMTCATMHITCSSRSKALAEPAAAAQCTGSTFRAEAGMLT